MALTRIDRRRLADRVTEQLLDLLDRGVVLVGDKLPSERELARSLGVSRPLVRESIRTLESMGLVEVKHGVGAIVVERRSSRHEVQTYVSSREPNALSALENVVSSTGNSGRAISRLELATILDILEAREILEVHIAELATHRISGEEADWLRAAAQSRTETWNDNREFHMMLASITHNFMLERLVAMQLDLLRDARQREHYSFPPNAARLLDEHGDIADAVIARDTERTIELMRMHFKNTRHMIVRDNASRTETEYFE